MTSYRLPDSTVVSLEELMDVLRNRYYTLEDFDRSLDYSNGSVTALGMQFKASEILCKLKPDLYKVLYEEDIGEILQECVSSHLSPLGWIQGDD